jgi:hypothetical protein
VPCKLEPFPPSLKLSGISKTINQLFITGSHSTKMSNWINKKFKNYKTMKIGIAQDPTSRRTGYKQGDVMYPFFHGTRAKCDDVEDKMISGLIMQHGASKISNKKGGGAGPSWNSKGYVYVVFSNKSSVEHPKNKTSKSVKGKSTPKTSKTKSTPKTSKSKSTAKTSKTKSTPKTSKTKSTPKTSKSKSTAKTSKSKSTVKSTERKSPRASANDFTIGTTKKGLDGKMWTVTRFAKSRRWQRK